MLSAKAQSDAQAFTQFSAIAILWVAGRFRCTQQLFKRYRPAWRARFRADTATGGQLYQGHSSRLLGLQRLRNIRGNGVARAPKHRRVHCQAAGAMSHVPLTTYTAAYGMSCSILLQLRLHCKRVSECALKYSTPLTQIAWLRILKEPWLPAGTGSRRDSHRLNLAAITRFFGRSLPHHSRAGQLATHRLVFCGTWRLVFNQWQASMR